MVLSYLGGVHIGAVAKINFLSLVDENCQVYFYWPKWMHIGY